MLQSIWIPKWLYRGLPWSAMAVGALGIWLGGFVLMVFAYLVFTYGACVLTERSTYTGVYSRG